MRLAHRICPKCGVVFEVKDDPKFCSEKCRMKFSESHLVYLKK